MFLLFSSKINEKKGAGAAGTHTAFFFFPEYRRRKLHL
jgi:hypothetical protein